MTTPPDESGITLDYVLDRARRCRNQSQFQMNYYKLYRWAKERGLLGEVEKVLPLVPAEERGRLGAAAKAYSDEEIIADAAKYPTRRAWKQAGKEERAAGRGYSHYGAALHRGHEFMAKCCAHMPDETGTTIHYTYTDEDLLASARQYQTRNEWKVADRNRYQAAQARPIWDECVAHMLPAANPFAKDYIVYVYEFTDGYCYVGLTFVPENRKIMHMQRGPVFEHLMVCPTVDYNVLESGMTFTEVGPAEDKWQKAYAEKGWKALHTAKAGSLGGIHGSKWTEDAVKAEARKYQTRQEWIKRSRTSYNAAKAGGWFDAASAHMPRRVLGVGVGREISPETREKMRLAKLGTKATPEQRAARSTLATQIWAERKKAILDKLPAPPETTAQTLTQLGIHHKKHSNALPPEEKQQHRLDTYRRSYSKRSETILAKLKAERDAEKLRDWQATLQAKGLPLDTPMPAVLSPLAALTPEERAERKRARERFNHAIRKATAAGDTAELERLRAERRKMDETIIILHRLID